jgi:NADH dehydrogenase
MAKIGRNAAVAEVGKHRHQVEGPLAFAAWLGVHAMLLSGVHSKVDTFLAWGWDYFDRDHAATIEATTATPQRLAWADHGDDVPHIVVDRPEATTPALRWLDLTTIRGNQDMLSTAESRVAAWLGSPQASTVKRPPL